MPRKLSRTTAIRTAFDACARPVYLLDSDRTILFCNRALLEWVGCEADDLLGRRCRYVALARPAESGHARGCVRHHRLEQVANGLSPPPEAAGDRDTDAFVAVVDANGFFQKRCARFIPLGPGRERTAGRAAATLVLVGWEDVTATDARIVAPHPEGADRPRDEAAKLHEQLVLLAADVASRYRIERLVGRSPAMHRVRTRVALAAENHLPVSIYGPPGSGRQHAARAIHYGRGDVEAGALLPVDCAVLGADVIESTIRAVSVKEGTGTRRPATLLLLDVDYLHPEIQRSLATLLAEGRFPLRVISTSIAPLAFAVSDGRLREDLAALLTAIEIEIPPVGTRRQDIPLLAQSLIEECNAQRNKQIGGLTSSALDRLDAYHWPGNVDEMFEVIESAHARCQGARIDLGDLPERLAYAHDAAARPRKVRERIVLDEYLADIERRLIQRALELSKGNRSKAAELLGINRPRLYRRLEQLGLD